MYRADFCPLWKLRYHLILYAPISQNGQTLKQFVGKIADELFVFDHFVGLVFKGLTGLCIHILSRS